MADEERLKTATTTTATTTTAHPFLFNLLLLSLFPALLPL